MKKIILFVSIILIAYGIGTAQENRNQEILQITGENPHYQLTMTRGGKPIGVIEIELFPTLAPKHCKNFDSLVSIGFYDGTAFHRVIPGFMIQGGDPNSRNNDKSTWGYGDPSQTTVPAEFSTKSHIRGILSAARATDPNSATSQFFICVAAATHLNGQYSVYGQVVKGMDVADIIVKSPRDAKDNPLEKIEMKVVKLAPANVEENNSVSDLRIFPNPTIDLLRFTTSSENFTLKEYQISDMNGKIYSSVTVGNVHINILSVPVRNLSVGVYNLTLTDTQNKSHNLKFVVQ